MPIIIVMQGKCLFSDISRPGTDEKFHRTACSVASFGTFLSRTLPYTAYCCTVSFSSNNPQTLLFAVAMNERRNANP